MLPGRPAEGDVIDDQPLPRIVPPLPLPFAKTDRRMDDAGCFAGSFDLLGEDFLADPETHTGSCNLQPSNSLWGDNKQRRWGD